VSRLLKFPGEVRYTVSHQAKRLDVTQITKFRSSHSPEKEYHVWPLERGLEFRHLIKPLCFSTSLRKPILLFIFFVSLKYGSAQCTVLISIPNFVTCSKLGFSESRHVVTRVDHQKAEYSLRQRVAHAVD
jgi:hypothetical protein